MNVDVLLIILRVLGIVAELIFFIWFFKNIWPEVTLEPSTMYYACVVCDYETPRMKVWMKTGESFRANEKLKKLSDEHTNSTLHKHMVALAHEAREFDRRMKNVEEKLSQD